MAVGRGLAQVVDEAMNADVTRTLARSLAEGGIPANFPGTMGEGGEGGIVSDECLPLWVCGFGWQLLECFGKS